MSLMRETSDFYEEYEVRTIVSYGDYYCGCVLMTFRTGYFTLIGLPVAMDELLVISLRSSVWVTNSYSRMRPESRCDLRNATVNITNKI